MTPAKTTTNVSSGSKTVMQSVSSRAPRGDVGWLVLDLRQLVREEEPDQRPHAGRAEQHLAVAGAKHDVAVVRADHDEIEEQEKRDGRKHVAGDARPGREGVDLAADPAPLAYGRGQVLKH